MSNRSAEITAATSPSVAPKATRSDGSSGCGAYTPRNTSAPTSARASVARRSGSSRGTAPL